MLQVFACSYIPQSAAVRFRFSTWWSLVVRGQALLARPTWTAGSFSRRICRVLFNYNRTVSMQRYDQELVKIEYIQFARFVRVISHALSNLMLTKSSRKQRSCNDSY